MLNDLSSPRTTKISRREKFALPVHRARSKKAYAPASVADGGHGIVRHRTPRQPAHAASQLRHPHGRKRRRPAHRANYPGPRRYFDYADLYACGAGSFKERVRETSSAGEGEMK